MKETKTKEELFIEQLIEMYGFSDYALINRETGEIQVLPNGSKTKFPTLPKTDKHQRVLERFLDGEKFVKLYKRSLSELDKELSYRNFTWFIRLSEYLGMRDCILYDDNGNYLNIKNLSELLDIDYDNLKAAFREFTKLELIKKVKVPSQKDVYKTVQAIAANPYLYMNGEYIVEEIRQQFADTKWAKLYAKK